jgi:Tfp pilus assembly protein PilF
MRTEGVALVLLALSCVTSAWAQVPGSNRSYQASGRVVMAGGAPVPLTTGVELICNGQVKKRVRVATNGDFSIELGNDIATVADISTPIDVLSRPIPFDARGRGGASAPSIVGGADPGRFDLSGCELRGVLPGYRSNVIALGPRRELDNPHIGQLVLRPLSNPDGIPTSDNTRAAPAKARKAFDNAWKALDKDKPSYAEAAKELNTAIREYPSFAIAWNLIGRTRLALGDSAGARDAFHRSITADINYVEPYVHLATMEAQEGRWAETVKWTAEAQRLDPLITYVYYLDASANFQLGEIEAAEKSALTVQKSRDLEYYPLVHYILGAVDAHHGKFDAAAAKFRQFLETKPDAATADGVKQILAEWERDGRVTKAP